MSTCNDVISAGILKDCEAINGSIGVDKDLTLVNYEEYDHVATMDAANVEADDTNNNVGGLTNIILKSGATQYVFEGKDYSVQPTVTGEVKEDGDTWFVHSLLFTVFNKSATARKVLKDLAGARVIAIVTDRSTGLKELFGAEQGLKVGALERAYVGNQNSNFYSVTIQTPDVAVVRESGLGELAVNVSVAV